MDRSAKHISSNMVTAQDVALFHIGVLFVVSVVPERRCSSTPEVLTPRLLRSDEIGEYRHEDEAGDDHYRDNRPTPEYRQCLAGT